MKHAGSKLQPAGRVRIVGGFWRSRLIRVPSRPGLRPTPDRVRETLFNWLGQDLAGLSCLDLFAGSGALGFEAASRGATRVVMVESDPATIESLRASRTALGAERVAIVSSEAFAYLAAVSERFDVVFLDPPFRQNALAAVLEALSPRLAPHARVYLEGAALPPVPEPWRELRQRRAGQVSFQLLQWSADDTSRLSGNV
ncbi:MAG: 16S rRNA (guanine(966)-N(2))-methyltransferase RsmD [Burkholderiales bacterium]